MTRPVSEADEPILVWNGMVEPRVAPVHEPGSRPDAARDPDEGDEHDDEGGAAAS